MKHFIIYVLSFFLPTFCIIAVVNYTIDPAHLYSYHYVDDIIAGIRDGWNVTNISNMDERLYKKKLAEMYQGHSFDYLVLGASRTQTISRDAVKEKTLLNLGVSGCKIEDMIALYEICIENNISFKKLILGVDPTLFNENDTDSRWKSIEKYYYTFEGKKQTISQNKFELIKNLFSVSYFQYAIRRLPNALHGNTALIYTKEKLNDEYTLRIDGSLYYAKKLREASRSWINHNAKTWMHQSLDHFDNLSVPRTELFDKFVKTLQSQGIEIIFFCSPYHPMFYKRIGEMKGYKEAFQYIDDFASQNNIKLIGNFNPNDIGYSDIDFYDATHPRKEVLDKLIQQGLDKEITYDKQ